MKDTTYINRFRVKSQDDTLLLNKNILILKFKITNNKGGKIMKHL